MGGPLAPAAALGAARPALARGWAGALLVAAAALAPRVAGLDDFYTIDEGYHWPGRVERFSQALAAGDWWQTNQTGHPGVTTMWLGSLGRAISFRLGIPDPGWAGGGALYLSMLRAPLAVAAALMALAGYLLLRRLLRPAEALAAGLLWALSPFLIAHGRLLHLDSLLTSFVSLSVLLLLVAEGADGDGRTSWAALAASGVCCGLALITKAPSLILLPYAGLATLAIRMRGRWSARGLATALPGTLGRYAIWLACAAATAFALWPAMWVSPAGAAEAVLHEIVANGGQPHDSGNYFLGAPVPDPGPLFYPAVLLLRTTPLTLIGLGCGLALAAAAAWGALRGRGWRWPRPQVLALVAFAALFTLLMTAGAKKLDRYLLPIWPSLCALAAVGLVRGLGALLGRAGRAQLAGALVCGAALLEGGATAALYHPYELAYYNPLVGGGPAAERTILVGQGEGMDQVGAWLRGRPDLRTGDVLSWIAPTLAPFVPADVLVRDLRPAFMTGRNSYAVLYVRSVQHKESAEAEAAVRQTPALFTVTLHGITYAEVHQLPRPFDTPADATFGGAVRLRGISREDLGSTLVISPSWGIEADRPGGAFVFVHLLGPDGSRVAQLDAPVDQGMFPAWQRGQQFGGRLPLALPAGLPDGEYRVVVGVYEPGGARLPLTAGAPLPDDVDGPQAFEAAQITRRGGAFLP